MLREDHERVEALFDRFEKARDERRKQELATEICNELTVHAQLEEEIFYPAAREAIGEDDLMNEATVEHQSAKDLIAQIESSSPGDEMFDAKVTVLGEYIRHHVKEEQGEMFKKVRGSDLDRAALAERMQERKMELMNGASGSGASRRGKRGLGAMLSRAAET